MIHCEIVKQRWRVRMHDCQLQCRFPASETRNQAPIIKIGCRRANPSNQADVHDLITSVWMVCRHDAAKWCSLYCSDRDPGRPRCWLLHKNSARRGKEETGQLRAMNTA